MRSLSPLALFAVLWALPAAAGDPLRPTVQDPLPYDHFSKHMPLYEAAGLTCADCHHNGNPMSDEGPSPRRACHWCHRDAANHDIPRSIRRQAPHECVTCHVFDATLKPLDHGPDWPMTHGPEARSLQASCDRCHETPECLSCHAERGPGATNPHGAAARATHGIEARMDPASCSACHDGNSCQQCHSQGVLPW